MRLTEAIELIKPGFRGDFTDERWADLGCGNGLFTKALASLLRRTNKIYAVDRDAQRIKIADDFTAAIEFIKLDFIADTLPFSDLDGILMANALHYVDDKNAFIEKLKSHMKPDGRFIIVEYDTVRANQWVPYPINLQQLTRTFSAHGFAKVLKIGERNSIYRSDKMYACSLERA
jgi:ubiquinone/menaquinone biosynthesis C-methylase UbiE